MKIRPLFAWYDAWVGAYWDRVRRRLYLFPLPCVGVVLAFRRRCLACGGTGDDDLAEPGCLLCGGTGRREAADG